MEYINYYYALVDRCQFKFHFLKIILFIIMNVLVDINYYVMFFNVHKKIY